MGPQELGSRIISEVVPVLTSLFCHLLDQQPSCRRTFRNAGQYAGPGTAQRFVKIMHLFMHMS